MENSIIEKSKELIDNYVITDISQLEAFLDISKKNKRLVENGLSKERGYNLLTTEEIYNQIQAANFSQILYAAGTEIKP